MTDLFEPDAETAAEFKSLMADPAARQAFVQIKAEAAENGAKRHYQHVLQAVSGSAWAIRPEMLALIVDLLAFRVAGGRLSAEEIDARIGAQRRTSLPAPPAGVAVLPLHGVIMPKASMMSDVSGGTSIDRFRGQFRQAMASTEVSGVVLDVDSPGGMVDGVPEMAAEIRAARGTKPIVAVANTQASSAAYWLASQADELVATTSGRVGSVGVFAAHEEESAKAQNEGVKTTLISAGKHKTEGNPYEPLSDDARLHLQAMVDEYFGMFVADVAKGRKLSVDAVRNGYGEGREVLAREALSAGMVDRIATTENVVAEMLGAAKLRPAATAFTGASTFVTSTDANTGAAALNEHGAEVAEMIDDGQHFFGAADDSAWDGNRAMGECTTAAQYSSICAGVHGAGQAGERQHYALPHHYLGRGPNAAGTRQALSRLPQTQDLTNRQAAQSHLEAHMREINPDANATALSPEREEEMSLRDTLRSLSL